jgi:hypothetical protein
MFRTVIVIYIYIRHKLIDIINLLGSWRRRNVFLARYGQTNKQTKDRTMDNVQNCDRYMNTPSS